MFGTRNLGYYATFHATADVVPSCELNVGALDFGNIPAIITSPIEGQALLRVSCTADTSFRIGLGLGNGSGVTGPTNRRMSNLLNSLVYGLYQDPGHGVPWGDTMTTSRPGTGVGGNEDMVVYGLINQSQNAAVGIYTDSVVVTVTY